MAIDVYGLLERRREAGLRPRDRGEDASDWVISIVSPQVIDEQQGEKIKRDRRRTSWCQPRASPRELQVR